MFELAVLLSSLACITFSAYLYRYASGESVLRLNMLTYSFWIMTVFSAIGSLILVLDLSLLGYRPTESRYLYDPRFRLPVLTIVLWAVVGIPLGAILCNVLTGGQSMRRMMATYRAAPIQPGWGLTQNLLFKIVWGGGVALSLLLLLQVPETTALSSVITTGDVAAGQIIRRARTGSGSTLVDSLFNRGTLQWLSYIAYAGMVITAQFRWRLLFGLLFAFMVYLNVSDGTIGHIAFYLVGFGVVRAMLGKQIVRLHEIIIVTSLVVVLTFTFKGAQGDIVNVAIDNVASRVITGQVLGTYLALEMFPGQHDFIGLRSTAKWFHDLMGNPSLQSYGLIMMGLYNPEGVEAGYAGHLSTIFMGEAWANFGLMGLIIAPLWVGVFVQLVNRAFIRRGKSAVALSLYAYLTITFGYITDFISFYYPLGTLLFVLGAATVFAFGRFVLLKPAAEPAAPPRDLASEPR